MAFNPKNIIGSAVGFGRAAVSAATSPFRGGRRDRATSTAPTTPGTPAATAKTTPATPAATAKTGRATPSATRTARAKSSGTKTTPKRSAPRRTTGSPATVGAAKPGEAGGHKSATAKSKPAAAKSKPRAKSSPNRTAATRAAARSGKDVADAASGSDDKS